MDALIQLFNSMDNLSARQRCHLDRLIKPYADFRRRLDAFLSRHFADQCSQSCFESMVSACCSKDGILIFWADLVVNACFSTLRQRDALAGSVSTPHWDNKCIYLKPGGCCWQVRPLVCAMFLCDQVQEQVFKSDTKAAEQWETLEAESKSFRWPDRPVLFDDLEKFFIERGCDSSLMHLHKSPGLLRVKQSAGFPEQTFRPASGRRSF